MRLLDQNEICQISAGGEATCTVSVGTNTSISCTGTASELGNLAVKVYTALSVVPGTTAWWAKTLF
jgi:hypothetical protein